MQRWRCPRAGIPAALGVALLALLACRGEPPERIREMAGELDLARTQYVEAFNSRDARALTALFTSDASLLPPSHAPVHGRPAVLAFWLEALSGEPGVLKLAPSTSRGVAGTAWESGTWSVGTGGQAIVAGSYVMIWRAVGKDWRVERMIWNLGPRPPAPSPEATPVPTPSEGLSDGSS